MAILNITFIFGRCRRSSAAVTPVKYGCDSKNLTCTFAMSKKLLTEKLTNGALVTPTPVLNLTTILWWYMLKLYTAIMLIITFLGMGVPYVSHFDFAVTLIFVFRYTN